MSGRLDPAEMFPAGRADVRVHWVTLGSGLRLRVAESGRPDAPVMLLVHGWGASIYMWRNWFVPLVAAGYRVLAVDLPGHGLSDKPDAAHFYRLDEMAGALRELIEQEGLTGVDVVAQSMGGTISLEVTRTSGSRVRTLVLVNPACFGRVRNQKLLQLVGGKSWFDPILPKLVAKWLVARTHRMVFGDPSGITHRDEDELWAPTQFPSFALSMRLLLQEFTWDRPAVAEMTARLQGIPARVMVVLGTLDRLVLDARPYVEALVRGGAPLAVAISEGGGHAVNEERPDEVVAHVLDFTGQPHSQARTDAEEEEGK